jgi:hypothetical protein
LEEDNRPKRKLKYSVLTKHLNRQPTVTTPTRKTPSHHPSYNIPSNQMQNNSHGLKQTHHRHNHRYSTSATTNKSTRQNIHAQSANPHGHIAD